MGGVTKEAACHGCWEGVEARPWRPQAAGLCSGAYRQLGTGQGWGTTESGLQWLRGTGLGWGHRMVLLGGCRDLRFGKLGAGVCGKDGPWVEETVNYGRGAQTSKEGGQADWHSLFVLAAPCGMQDLSSPTRDRTRVPCIGSTES